jgi:hypothetical protein
MGRLARHNPLELCCRIPPLPHVARETNKFISIVGYPIRLGGDRTRYMDVSATEAGPPPHSRDVAAVEHQLLLTGAWSKSYFDES